MSTVSTAATTEVVTTTTDGKYYEDECEYGLGHKYKCGDKCTTWDQTCTCGQVQMDFFMTKFQHHCCPQSAPCEESEGQGDVFCPDGKVLDMIEMCGDRCYNDWEKSKVIDPVNAHYRCDKNIGNGRCLPVVEMCQGLDICGEVKVCNEQLRCAKQIHTDDGFDKYSLNAEIVRLYSELTNEHHFCHYPNYFDGDQAQCPQLSQYSIKTLGSNLENYCEDDLIEMKAMNNQIK